MPDPIAVYDKPSTMEPLLPESDREGLAELTTEILQAAGKLSGSVHSPVVREQIANLVREMNCYYSNLIEGHKTTPREIEQAMREDFSQNPEERDKQKLGLAHIAVERLMEERLAREAVDVYSPDFVRWLHREFYAPLPESMREAKTKSGKTYVILPGECRDFMVDVGSHIPPHYEALPAFLDRFHAFYGSGRIYATNRLVAIAAAHHRLAWIHPFGDGNGRVMRLHSHALLIHHRIEGHGLWTISRGLARNRTRYYELLSIADREREGDVDGRGNLSDRGLARFCRFFLETILDQIRFMENLLQLGRLRSRVENYFQRETPHIQRYREELMRVVRVLIDEGEIPRARVEEITGKGATIAAKIIHLGLDERLISSPSPKGVLRVAFPSKVLESYFPRLFIDLPVQTDGP